LPPPASRIPVSRSTKSTSPSVSGRGIRARGSSFRSSVRKPVRPTAYAKGTPRERCSTACQNRSTSSTAGSWARRSHTSPGLVPAPATAAHSIIASRRGPGRPEAARRSAASCSASPIEVGCAARSGTEPLLFTREPQGVDQVVEATVQHLGEVVDGVMDAMVGDAVLREVVRANLGRAVSRADLGSALAGAGGFLFGDHLVEQAGAQHLERLDLVLQLTLLVLALDHETRGQVRDAHGAVGRVDALAAGSLGAEHVDPEVLLFDLHVDLLRFREHGHRRGGRRDAPLRLGNGNALDPVDPRRLAPRPVGSRGGPARRPRAPRAPARARGPAAARAPGRAAARGAPAARAPGGSGRAGRARGPAVSVWPDSARSGGGPALGRPPPPARA